MVQLEVVLVWLYVLVFLEELSSEYVGSFLALLIDFYLCWVYGDHLCFGACLEGGLSEALGVILFSLSRIFGSTSGPLKS